MANIAQRRLGKEIKSVTSPDKPFPNLIDVQLEQDSLFTWKVTFSGPDPSPYAKGIFKMVLTATENYPHEAPKVRFLTKVFHPGVSFTEGTVCENLLADWTPDQGMLQVIQSVMKMMEAVGVEGAPQLGGVNVEASELLGKDRAAFMRKAADVTKAHAKK